MRLGSTPVVLLSKDTHEPKMSSKQDGKKVGDLTSYGIESAY